MDTPLFVVKVSDGDEVYFDDREFKSRKRAERHADQLRQFLGSKVSVNVEEMNYDEAY